MKRSLFLIFLICLTVSAFGQKSRVLSVMQMIDSKKYSEAKEAIELAVWNDRTANWHRTYYAKGMLCQTAYEDGKESKDIKLTNLYEDQLYVAYDSYEKAVELDSREKIHSTIAKKYYSLSNDFRQLGLEHYTKKEYPEALRAFEHALLMINSKLLNVPADTNLVYNTAMAAYESGNWEKAIGYLTGLHADAFSPATSLFLVHAHLYNGDTLQAETVMMEGVKNYAYSDTVVMYVVNWYTGTHRTDRAIEVLQEAIKRHPDEFRFHWALGLVYSALDNYLEAIESLKKADDLCTEKPPELYYQLGVCYYNIAIDLREAALQISENDEYMEVRDQYLAQFREAVKWLEKSYELDPGNEKTINRLYQLYYRLQMKEKQETFEQLMQ
ncbi:MAG: tetratricopeptide repeat protein [Bacteroidia bacterium]|nr:MAG: tetratricopeptide repeat protein [Bacteroidia bacterium]